MTTDPISDFISQIKNGYMASKKQVVIPYSKMKEAIAKILSKKGYIGEFTVYKGKNVQKDLIIKLSYDGKKPHVTEIKMVSKPGKRVYVPKRKIFKVLGGIGCAIISTSSGLMTDAEARKKGVGGEVICKLW